MQKEEKRKLDTRLHCGNTNPGSALKSGVVLAGCPLPSTKVSSSVNRGHLATPVCPHLHDRAGVPASLLLLLLLGSGRLLPLLLGSRCSRVETLPASSPSRAPGPSRESGTTVRLGDNEGITPDHPETRLNGTVSTITDN